VAKLPWCLSSPQQANQFIAARVSRNERLNPEKATVYTSVSTRNKHGHDEETHGKEEKKKCPQTFSSSPNVVHKGISFSNDIPSSNVF
jgi:hypothetical protein